MFDAAGCDSEEPRDAIEELGRAAPITWFNLILSLLIGDTMRCGHEENRQSDDARMIEGMINNFLGPCKSGRLILALC